MINKNNISIYLPTRSGSERVPNKNTRKFAGIEGGILKIKLEQLIKIDGVKEIILSTNDKSSIDVAKKISNNKIVIIERPDHLCMSDTKVSDLIKYVADIVDNKFIFWVHATSPFVEVSDYKNAINIFLKNIDKDKSYSLASVSEIQQFLWDNEKKKMINWNVEGGNWPRTQDLKPVYEINHAFYISSKENYLKYNNRVSPNMDIYELSKIKQLDIDWKEDFQIAELIYEHFNK